MRHKASRRAHSSAGRLPAPACALLICRQQGTVPPANLPRNRRLTMPASLAIREEQQVIDHARQRLGREFLTAHPSDILCAIRWFGHPIRTSAFLQDPVDPERPAAQARALGHLCKPVCSGALKSCDSIEGDARMKKKRQPLNRSAGSADQKKQTGT